jgi:hypothetical protein
MLRILGVELTQAIQYFDSTHPVCGSPPNLQPCADNSVPLVAGKPTAVRVYFSGASQGVPVTGFGVRLYPNGAPSTVTFPATTDLVNVPLPPVREDPGQSINIIVPAEQSSGSWKLSLSIFEKPPAGVGQISTWLVDVSFDARALVPLRLVRFNYRRSPAGAPAIDVPAPTVAEFWSLAAGFVQHLWPSPLPVFCLVRESVEIFDGIYDCSDGIYDGTNPDGTPLCFGNPGKDTQSAKGTTGSISEILARLKMTEALPTDVVYCGFYPAAGGAGLPGGGYGGGLAFVTPNVIPGLMAHELGHALGLPHAPTPSFKPTYADADQGFPRYGSLEWGTIGEAGFDTIKPAAVEPGSTAPGPVPPGTTFDIMGYDVPRWISPHHYMKLFAAVGPPKPGACSKLPSPVKLDRPPTDRYFSCYYVEGLPGGDFIRKLCGPAIPFQPEWSPKGPPGPIRVTLHDGRGVTMFEDTVRIATLSEPPDAPGRRGFWITVPEMAGATRLVVTHGDQVIEDSELQRGRIGFDARARLLDGPAPRVHVEWALPHEDPTASICIRASSDEGRSWTAFNVSSGAKGIEIDPASLPPGDGCVVEVLVGERLRTTSWRSAHIPVETGRDAVIVLAPRDDMSVSYGQSVELMATTTYGSGYGDLIWSSDRDGDLGTGGAQLARLSPGRHVLSVRRGECGKRVRASVVRVSLEARPTRLS